MPAAEVSFSKRTFGKGRSALPEARHQLDEVAGFVAAVELVFEDTVPPVLHRSGRDGQRKDIGAARDTGARTRLHRRGDRKSTRLNSSHSCAPRMPSTA